MFYNKDLFDIEIIFLLIRDENFIFEWMIYLFSKLNKMFF